ncbi:MAG: 6-phosphogluconolactonase [Thermoplasmata archaeon]|jgi:6-phosphogluconolactonase|nr:6-phosphogluconolactonase [Thermoplasmata archaeon]
MERGLARGLRVFPDLSSATAAAARHVRERAVEAVRARGRFAWVLAGGHTPEGLYRLLARSYRARFPWRETEIYFGDERCVSPRSLESNYATARDGLLARVPIRRTRIHRLLGEVRPPSRAAAGYARALGTLPPPGDAGAAWFDLVLLGIGPDGHTASLFPGSRSLSETRRSVVAVRRAGRPPFLPRLTMTLPALAASREVLFLAAGADKADAVAAIFHALPNGTPEWPASLVRSTGPVVWYVDRAAASRL